MNNSRRYVRRPASTEQRCNVHYTSGRGENVVRQVTYRGQGNRQGNRFKDNKAFRNVSQPNRPLVPSVQPPARSSANNRVPIRVAQQETQPKQKSVFARLEVKPSVNKCWVPAKSDVKKVEEVELARPIVQPPIVIHLAEEVKLTPTTVQPAIVAKVAEVELKQTVAIVKVKQNDLFAMYASLIIFDDDIVIPLPTSRCAHQHIVRKAIKRPFEGDNYDLNDKVNERPCKKYKFD